MKKNYILLTLLSLSLTSCNNINIESVEQSTNETDISENISLSIDENSSINYRENVKTVDQIAKKELYRSCKFFYDNISTTQTGYGLIADRYSLTDKMKSNHNSIASVGFGLACLPIDVENNYYTYEDCEQRTLKTLQTISSLDTTRGFYYHFLNDNGERMNKDVEVSIIDTAIMVLGCLVAGQYFGGTCKELANNIYEKVQWDWYYNESVGKFYMGYMPEKGFSGYWNEYAEQLMVYVLAAGSPTHKVGIDAYNVMKRLSKKAQATNYYDSFYMTYTGSLFTYQFSHAFIDFNKLDEDGINWFTNSINASKAAIQYAKTMSSKYKTLTNIVWGLTASDGPNGYTGAYGSKPCSGNNLCDGTVAPCAAIGSIVFTPQETISCMNEFFKNPNLWSDYGFIDAYNLGTTDSYTDSTINIPKDGWYDKDVIGIDKGIGALMIENYISGLIWNITNHIPCIQNGLEELKIK